MSLSEEDKFDEEKERQEWRNAFEHAADTPPDRVWEAIVRQLDEQESRPIVPLWRQPAGSGFRPWVYGAVAAVALLLIGWWSLRSVETPKTESVADRGLSSPNGATNAPAAQSHTPSRNTPGTDLAATQKPQTANEQSDQLAVPHSRAVPSRDQAGHLVALNSTRLAVKSGLTQRQSGVDAYRDLSNALTITRQSALALGDLYPETAVERATNNQRLTYEASLLPNRAIASRRAQPISRIVWYRAPDAIEPQKLKRSKKNELWAGLSATPMSFNPVAAIAQPASAQSMAYNYLTVSNVNSSKTAVQNEAQLSMAWQANAGVQVSKHWSVETGVQYLNGKSQARNNTSVFRLATNQAENALVNAVRNSSATSSPINASSDVYTATGSNALVNPSYTTVIPTSDQVTNNFEYLQIPVQAGYHIQPDRKVSYAVLGGLLANVFLQNTIDGSLDVKPSDQVYRPLLLAGTAGLRVSYQATAHWFGSLTGSYQRALQSGTHSNAQLTTHPQAVGVGLGLNYRF